MTESKIHWKEVSPGNWARDFDPVEKTLNLLTFGSPLLIQYIISIGAVLPEKRSLEEVKDAWAALRYFHPVIGCTITTTGFEYQVPTEEGIRKWVEDTVVVDNSGKPGRELLLSAVAPKNGASELHFMPDRNEICLLLRHEVVDGIGSLILLNQYLKMLRQGTKVSKFGDEPALLTPSITEILKAEEPSAAAIEEAHRIRDNYTKKRAIGLKTKPLDPAAPVTFQQVEHEFSEAETSAIIRACKERGITVIHATNAAMALAILENSGETSGNYCGVGPVSMRDLLPAPYNTPEGGVGNLITAIFPMLEVSTSSEFLDLAEQISELYSWWKYKPDNVQCISALPDLLAEGFAMAAALGIEVPATVATISLGIIEKHVTEPVQDFWFNLGFSVSTSAMYVYTSKGRLRFALCYSSAFHDTKGMEGVVDRTVHYLNRGLALKGVLDH
ncbi:hypothetical protein TWF481_010995 [Arthrobotrys musiformis]|uniref:Phthiocerol/phthiodiolone dimycocerosyl transferase C-terminal domain-containing protein n=1 Tax=Arthrobotrys musiformis TaxID=47236 RepID=A0AAV9VX65_9PEZI